MNRMTESRAGEERTEEARGRTSAVPLDDSREAMMRRVKRMTIEERLDLFEQLSRDAAWALSAKRVR